ncbi:MAG: hypothetical protein P8Y36_07830 [Alphaproteobacteria bacterium]
MLAFSEDAYTFKISKTGLMTIVAALMLFALSYVSVNLALAQTAPAPAATGGVDFSPLAMQVIALVGFALTAIVGVLARSAVRWLASKARINDSEAERLLADRVGDILVKSVDYAESWAKAQVADPNSPMRHVQIDNFFVREAVRYAMNSMPDLISHFGITEARLEDMVRARLAPLMGDPEVNSGSVPHAMQTPASATFEPIAKAS